MTYKIENIEQLILKIKSSKESLQEDFDCVLYELQNEIKAEIRREIYCKKNIKETKLFIYNHFNTLQYFTKQLNSLIEKKESQYYIKIQKTIKHLFNYLLNRYSEYINPQSEVPASIITGIAEEYNSKSEELKLMLEAKKIDKKLIEILHSKYNQMINSKITFQRMQYMKLIYEKLKQLVDTNSIELNNEAIIKLLIEENFNSIDITQYIIELIKKELKKRKSIQGKISKLTELRKFYLTASISSKQKYNSQFPGIIKMLKIWIKEEKQNIKSENKKNNENDIVEKLSTNCSVEQLCIFFRILNETKILYHHNQSEIFRFISNHIKTVNTAQISQASIKSKYYSHDLHIYNALKPKIIEMLNKIKK